MSHLRKRDEAGRVARLGLWLEGYLCWDVERTIRDVDVANDKDEESHLLPFLFRADAMAGKYGAQFGLPKLRGARCWEDGRPRGGYAASRIE